MSHHDCAAVGSLPLRPAVTLCQVQLALTPFLAEQGTNWDHEVAQDNIEFDEGSLLLQRPFRGDGGHDNEHVNQMVARLTPLRRGANALALFDDDTGDWEAMCRPVCLGNDTEQCHARLHYGIAQMAPWVSPLCGPARFRDMAEHIVATLTTPAGPQAERFNDL